MLKVIIYLLIFVMMIVGYVKYLETRGLYFPHKKIEFTPEILHIPFEDVYFKTPDGIEINGWFIPKEGAGYTILFCHGNAGNVSHRLEKIVLLRQAGANVFIIDYRGYGKSRGRPSEKGLYLDAFSSYNYLIEVKKINPRNIILYGESLGGAVVIDLAGRQEVGGLILEGTFSTGRDMAKRIYPFLPALLFRDSFNSLEKIKGIKAPKLFIHSKEDEIVPFSLAEKLYNSAPEPRQIIEIKGGHNTALLDSQEIVISSLKKFLQEL